MRSGFQKVIKSVLDESQAMGGFTVYIQLWIFAYVQLLNKPYVNEVTLREQNLPLKCYQPPEIDTECVGQRATKILTVKVGGLKKSLLPGPCPS